jgi:hypothetical protein
MVRSPLRFEHRVTLIVHFSWERCGSNTKEMAMRKMTRRIVTALAAALLMALPASAQVVVADAGEDLDLECSAVVGTDVNLDGRGSTVDGVRMDDPSNPYAADVTYLWEALDVDFDDETSPTPMGDFPVGLTTVTLNFSYIDPASGLATVSTDTMDVSIGDTTPPTVAGAADPAVLWPPNHKLRQVDVDLIVLDSCDPDPTVLLTSLVSNEPDNDTGDGNTVDDIQEVETDTDDRSFLLRAERKGNGSGRVYTATYNATDASGNFTDGVVEVLVPHDMGDMKAAKAAAKAAKKMAKAAAKAEKKAAKAAKKAAKVEAKAAKKAAKAEAKAAKKAAKAAAKAAKRGY